MAAKNPIKTEEIISTKGRRSYKGTVVSDKNDKTIVVLVSTYKKHKLYGKAYLSSKKYHAHDEENRARIGDLVSIEETRQQSKKKHCRLVKILERKGKV